MPTIEGAYGPHFLGADPEAGVDAVHTLTIGGTPTGGTFRLGMDSFVSPPIEWSATNNTLFNNIAAALNGVAEVQTITFGGAPTGGTFRLRYRGQQTAPITWSSTNNTLRDNVDAALEGIPYIGTGGVTTAVGTMTNGVGTLTVTFATTGVKSMIEVAENYLTYVDGTARPTIQVAETTPGSSLPPIGDGGVVVADAAMIAGIGTASITFSGDNHEAKAMPLLTVAENALTGTDPTVAVTEDTAGVSASFRGAREHALLVGDGEVFINTSAAQKPTWTLVGPA